MSEALNKILEEVRQDQFNNMFIDNALMLIIGVKGDILFASKPLCSFLGFKESELLKQDIGILNAHSQDKVKFKSLMSRTLKGYTWRGELSICSKGGKSNRLGSTVIPLKNDKGKVEKYFALFKTEKEYPGIEEFINYDIGYNTLFKQSPVPKRLSKLSDKSFVDVNNAWEEFSGYLKEEVLGKLSSDLNLIEPDKQKLIRNKLLKEESIEPQELSFNVKKGKKKKVLISFQLIDVNNEKYVLATINDIDDLEKSKEELRIAKEFSEELIASMQEGFIVTNSNYSIIEVNNSFCEMLGFTKDELLGLKPPYPYWPPELHEEINQKFTDTLDSPLKEFETSFMKKTGEQIPVLLSGSIIKNKKGEINAFFGTVVDISLRKKAELELKSAKKFTDKLIMSMQEGLIIVDLKGGILMVNNSTCEILGYSQNELVGLNLPYPFARIEDFEKIKKTNKEISKGEVPTFYFEFIRKNGERFMASFLTGNIKNDQGEVIALFGTMKDISDELKLTKTLEERAIKSAEKKEVIIKLTELVGGDLGNVFREIASLSAKILNVGRVSVWKFNKDKTEIHCEEIYNSKDGSFSNHLVFRSIDYPNYFKALLKNKTIKVDDARKHIITKEFTKEYFEPHNITSTMDVFIQGAEGSYGVICFEHIGSIRKWTAEDEEFASSIANIVSLSVESVQRKEAEIKLRLEKEFSEELMWSMHEGFMVIDPDSTILNVNPSFCKMFGYAKNELIGLKAPYPFWLPETYEQFGELFAKIEKTPLVQYEIPHLRKNGEQFPAIISGSTVKNREGMNIAFFGTVIDITELKKKETILKELTDKSIKRKEVILTLAGLVGGKLDEVFKEITQMSAETLNVARVSVWSFDKDKSEIHCQTVYNLQEDSFSNHLILKAKDYPNYFIALNRSKTIRANDACNDEITKEFAKGYLNPLGITSMMDVFIQGAEGSYGIICFEHIGSIRKWTAEDEEFATSIANIVSLSVESIERKEAEKKLIKTNEKLLKVNTELNKLKKELEQENVYLREEIDLVFNYEEMVYGSAVFSEVLTDVERVAATNATVLLLGESGTGKELLARAIHNISERKNKPLIKVNCAAIPKELIESELFGHKKGAFTGAINDRLGKFKLADGGTLFLDEIGELPLDMQPKLLRAIQEFEIEQVGGVETQKIDIRIIAATNKDLQKEVKEKRFREDLFFRINVFPIVVPPLRERVEDIPILIEHFVNKFSKAYNKNIKYISEAAKQNMQTYQWMGNIRELENVIERAVILSNDEKLILPNFESSSKEKLISSTDLTLDDVQRMHIVKVLKKCKWKIDGPGGASDLLEIKPSTLRDRMKKLGIKKPK